MSEPVKVVRVEALDTAIAATQAAADQAQQATSDVQASATLIEQAAGMGRVADEAALAGRPAGTYELIATNERVAWDGSAITTRGPMLQPVLSGVADYARTPSADIANGAPVRGPEVLDMRRKLRAYADTYGQYDNSTVLAAFSNPSRMPGHVDGLPPRTTVLGFGSREEVSTYLGRDSVTGFFGAYARAANVSTAAKTTYTATSAYVPGCDLSGIVPGMLVDTMHGPNVSTDRWSGFITAVNPATSTITVDKWTRNKIGQPRALENVETGTPDNGVACRVNSETSPFSLNTILWLGSDAEAHQGVGYELDVINYRGDYSSADGDDVRIELDGLKIVSTGGANAKLNHNAASAEGKWFNGFYVSGAHENGVVVEASVANNLTGDTGTSPSQGFHDASNSKVAYRASGKHIYAVQDVATVAGASYSAEGTGPRGVSITGNYDTKIFTRGKGTALQIADTKGRDVLNLTLQNDDGLAIMELGNGVSTFLLDMHAPGAANDYSTRLSTPGNGVFQIEFADNSAKLLNVLGNIRSVNNYQVGEKQVVGPRQPGIANATADLNSLTNTVNAILVAMRAHGLIES